MTRSEHPLDVHVISSLLFNYVTLLAPFSWLSCNSRVVSSESVQPDRYCLDDVCSKGVASSLGPPFHVKGEGVEGLSDYARLTRRGRVLRETLKTLSSTLKIRTKKQGLGA
ncbi:unnamed protein product [Nezara viridula]|uniref:Uncharacterized protein n=1 Tax=Nezara viridula TaxID=85310 RepID=A0A9P0H4N9_NEZVI|nr:unnamed protein product [Nezara viridula]